MSYDVEAQFDAAMHEIYRRTKEETGYNATRFIQILNEHRGIETARMLLHSPTSEGYTALWERDRLDLTVEALILDNPEFHTLFEPEEVEMARNRLRDYRYPPALHQDH